MTLSMRTRIKGRCTATVAEFIVPGWGDKVKSGTGLLYRPASHVARRAGTTGRAGVDFIPSQGP
jgi:hypothetical protein